jgi:prophage regulatory protein
MVRVWRSEKLKVVKLIRLSEVKAKTGLCTSVIYAGMREGSFPRNYPISKQARAWNEEEVDAWIKAKIDAARAMGA